MTNFRLWLIEELADRKRKNPAYSLHAFSKFLGVSAPSLSQVLSGKRPLSRKAALKIISRCSLSPEKAKAFLASALGFGDFSEESLDDNSTEFQNLEIDTFRLISDWYHYPILSLGNVKTNLADPTWLADKIGISVTEAREAFDRLLRLGLIQRRGRGFLKCTKPLSTPSVRSAAALRKYHSQNLDRAQRALDMEDVQVELYSAMTMAIDETRLPEARQLIKDFRRKLCALLESGRQERVYTLAVQLFPATKK